MAALPINLFEYEQWAQGRMPKDSFDFIAGGATDEITLARTRQVYDSIFLRPRVLIDISSIDTSTTVLGHQIAIPVMLAPAGAHNRAHPDGELASARAAANMGTVMVLSSASSMTLESVAMAAAGPKWFQMLIYKDRDLTRSMADRAAATGFRALCVTLDTSVRAKRERNIRNGYVGPDRPNYAGVSLPDDRWDGSSKPSGVAGLADRAATWTDLEWLADYSSLPVVVKGILSPLDAALCAQHGVEAIMVSNHGARNLDTTLTTPEALPDIVDAVNGQVEVYVDGGIRRGTDVLKALALGARAVLIGRPVFWGLCAAGAEGVCDVLQILHDELEAAMAMCGRPSIGTIDRTLLGIESPLRAALSAKAGPANDQLSTLRRETGEFL
jgi:4-hydroxymandelate oxidase